MTKPSFPERPQFVKSSNLQTDLPINQAAGNGSNLGVVAVVRFAVGLLCRESDRQYNDLVEKIRAPRRRRHAMRREGTTHAEHWTGRHRAGCEAIKLEEVERPQGGAARSIAFSSRSCGPESVAPWGSDFTVPTVIS